MNIVILDGYASNPGDLNWDLLEQLGNVTVYPRTNDDEKIERAKDADIILINKVQILSALAWCLVNKADSLTVTLSECVGNTVLNAESNMVNTLITLVKPFLDCALW